MSETNERVSLNKAKVLALAKSEKALKAEVKKWRDLAYEYQKKASGYADEARRMGLALDRAQKVILDLQNERAALISDVERARGRISQLKGEQLARGYAIGIPRPLSVRVRDEVTKQLNEVITPNREAWERGFDIGFRAGVRAQQLTK